MKELFFKIAVLIATMDFDNFHSPYYKGGGDLSDVGNDIGRAIGEKLSESDIDDFIHGFKHGVSIANGTHP